MIKKLEEKYIDDIAQAHCFAWQKGFQKILSEQLLDDLKQEDFAKNWKEIIKNKTRMNYVFLQKNKAVGFVSFGSPKNNKETANFEIYGLYVHPDFWKKKIGYQLLQYAVKVISDKHKNAKIILWTMTENWQSRNFYERFGFAKTSYERKSSRNNEDFREIKFFYDSSIKG